MDISEHGHGQQGGHHQALAERRDLRIVVARPGRILPGAPSVPPAGGRGGVAE